MGLPLGQLTSSQEVSREGGEGKGLNRGWLQSFFKEKKKHRETIFQPMDNNTSPQQINNHSNSNSAVLEVLPPIDESA